MVTWSYLYGRQAILREGIQGVVYLCVCVGGGVKISADLFITEVMETSNLMVQYFCHQQTILRKGNVFKSVCLSTEG